MPDKPSDEKKLEIAKEELRIVRRFLRRNNLDELCAALQQTGDSVHGAKVIAGMHPVPADQKTAIPFQNVDWDSDGYFNNQEPTRLTVPTGFAGRYFVQIAIRWHNPEEASGSPDIGEIRESYFYAFASQNGRPHAIGVDARSTANKVGHVATGTTQHFTFDLSLSVSDFVELNLWQDFFDPVRADVVLEIRRVGA